MQNSKKGQQPIRYRIALSKEMSPKTSEKFENMRKIPYALVVGTLMYAMLCMRLDICYAIGIFNRYKSNLGS